MSYIWVMKELDKKISALTEEKVHNAYLQFRERWDIEFDEQTEKNIERNFKKGFRKGYEDEKIKIAKRLLKMNMPFEDILKFTELSKEELENIINEEQN